MGEGGRREEEEEEEGDGRPAILKRVFEEVR